MASESKRTTSVGPTRRRLSVPKAYKMYVGGAFIRSESGRYYQVSGMTKGSADAEVVNVPLGSRKDARDAVLAAKAACAGWSSRAAFNRGQILYRLAEVLESRREEFVTSLVRAGATERDAESEVDASVDRAIWYAGIADKVSSLVASHNPVSGPHFGFTLPEPMGLVAVLAPQSPTLLGLVSTILPVIVTGNTSIVVAGESDPRTAVIFCECLATSDLPGGVVNVLTGRAKDLGPQLANHREVNALEAWTPDAELRTALERDGAGSVKRVKTHDAAGIAALRDERRGQGLSYVERFLEMKTVWHPVGV